jgi:hypothetical protein
MPILSMTKFYLAILRMRMGSLRCKLSIIRRMMVDVELLVDDGNGGAELSFFFLTYNENEL